jgi:hypothetical protein
LICKSWERFGGILNYDRHTSPYLKSIDAIRIVNLKRKHETKAEEEKEEKG